MAESLPNAAEIVMATIREIQRSEYGWQILVKMWVGAYNHGVDDMLSRAGAGDSFDDDAAASALKLAVCEHCRAAGVIKSVSAMKMGSITDDQRRLRIIPDVTMTVDTDPCPRCKGNGVITL